jgi:hypothetical protein
VLPRRTELDVLPLRDSIDGGPEVRK